MILKNTVKQDFYDIIVNNIEINMINGTRWRDGKDYAIEVIYNPEYKKIYHYEKRGERDNDFEELSRFKEIYDGRIKR